jgi:hypothetical protein
MKEIYMIEGVEEDRLLDVEEGNINEITVKKDKIDEYGIS